MPPQKLEVRDIILNQGLIIFTSDVPSSTKLISGGCVPDVTVDNNFAKLKVTANRAANTFTLKRVPNDAADYDGVNIRTVDAQATFGTVDTPGYVYTGDFSGCVFYLYRTGPGKITGVHAYRGSQPETKTTGSLFWKRTQINQVVREYGPTDYFTRNPGTLICSYPTRGELDLSTGEISMAFLSVVDRATAITYLFSVAGSPQGSRIKRLIRTYRADF